MSYKLNPEEISDIIQMAWCDKTSFDDIKDQTGLSEKEVIDLMKNNLTQKLIKKIRLKQKV